MKGNTQMRIIFIYCTAAIMMVSISLMLFIVTFKKPNDSTSEEKHQTSKMMHKAIVALISAIIIFVILTIIRF